MSAPNAAYYAQLMREAIAKSRSKIHPELAEQPELEPEPTDPEATADE